MTVCQESYCRRPADVVFQLGHVRFHLCFFHDHLWTGESR